MLCVKHVHCTCLMYIIPESTCKLLNLRVCDVAFIFCPVYATLLELWYHGLCVHAPGIITYIVPCYTAGKNAEAVEESCLKYGIYSLIPLANIYCHATVRGKIREKKNIEVSHLMAYTRYKFMCVCSYFTCVILRTIMGVFSLHSLAVQPLMAYLHLCMVVNE